MVNCLYTIKEFKLNCSDTQVHHPYYFAIADYNNTLVCYWDLSYKASQLSIWDLETGEHKRDFELAQAHEFGLGKNGKVCVVNFQDFVWKLDIETQELIGNHANNIMSISMSNPRCFAICSTQTLFVVGNSVGNRGEFEVWNYETYSRHLHHQFEGVGLTAQGTSFSSSKPEALIDQLTPFLFTPDGKILVVTFKKPNKRKLQIWDLETGELLQTLDDLPISIMNALAISADGNIFACGTRESQVCVWELISDKILYQSTEVSPCLMSADGRILIHCTKEFEIVVWDLVENQERCKLSGHTAPIVYITMSSDRQFIASYSLDRSIKIWGLF
ncbi:WD40 repeat domain-containing protein [Anabaena azotica]|uniref:WD40 repeat domain-containing protein n=1 Tax=Anabaena azotica TaxID=197653 RepID=UPI0039A4898B